jgi:class 3 adenylate cyclase/tetratricopeptide (TPR) repeat protein
MCGAVLPTAEPARHEERKLVTVVFADLTGSTSLGERLDPETLRGVLRRYYEALRAVLERHGGTVEKFVGDAVMAVFGVPHVHEDDALRAVRAAAELQSALAALNDELARERDVRLELRIGVNTGDVVAGGGTEALVTGDAVNVAARLEQAAAPGEILLGALTHELVRDAVEADPVEPVAAKGKREPVRAYRLVAVGAGEGRTRRHDTTFVGRTRELALLREAFARSAGERACHLFTVVGPPGVGKSRLLAEFLAGLDGGATVVRGRCLPYGEGITYWPALEVVRQLVGYAEDDAPDVLRHGLARLLAGDERRALVASRIESLFGLGPPAGTSDEAAWAVRRLFEAAAGEAPLVVVLDDIQWGESTFLDLVDHVADWSRDAPILLVCLARPELLELRPGWGGGKLNASSILLEPLGADESKQLIAGLLDDDRVPAEAVDRVVRAAAGNPLFVEEMLALLVDAGALRRTEEGWSAVELDSVPVPTSIRALLAAGLDRLSPEERTVLETGAVEGEVFHRGAVTTLAATGDQGTRLLQLVRRELIRPERATFADDEAFRFRHLLVRDAAYDALPKELRATLHERFAEWLAGRSAALLAEYEEIVAYHLEQAYRYRAEIAPADPSLDGLAERAALHMAAAGERAYLRVDMHAAVSLLGRAATLLPELHPARVRLLPLLGLAHAEIGDPAQGLELHREAVRAATALGDEVTLWRARVSERWSELETGSDARAEETMAMTAEAVRVLSQHGDDLGLAYAWRLRSDMHQSLGQGREWTDALERAAEHGRRSGARHAVWWALGILGGSLFFGPTPAPEAEQRLRRMLVDIGDDPLLQASLRRPLGGIVAIQGRIDEGRELVASARAVFEELGNKWGLAALGFVSGPIERLAGDLPAAERELRRSLDLYASMGEASRRSTIAAELGDVLCRQGKFDEALEIADVCDSLTHRDDVTSVAGGLSLRARLAAREGLHDEAEALARRAVEASAETDLLGYRWQGLLALADVLVDAGRPSEALQAAREALTVAEQKGNVVDASSTRAFVERLELAG